MLTMDQLGNLLGCLMTALFGEHLGRKNTLRVGAGLAPSVQSFNSRPPPFLSSLSVVSSTALAMVFPKIHFFRPLADTAI